MRRGTRPHSDLRLEHRAVLCREGSNLVPLRSEVRVNQYRMPRLLICVALLGVCASAGVCAAAAKGPDHGAFCGAFTCIALQDEPSVQPIISWWRAPFTPRAAPPSAAYYRIQLRDRLGSEWLLLYVPKHRTMRIWQREGSQYTGAAGPYWRRVPASAVLALRGITRQLMPLRAPTAWPKILRRR